ncbi:hypothetical protein ACLK29_18305 [Leptospira kirschneri]|uniref:hypothetical protein n=1 Tax=Leptospira kirschneri TaxID=29507 RepID=UPI00398A77DE
MEKALINSINSVFTKEVTDTLYNAVHLGYILTEKAFKELPILKNIGANDIRPHIRRIAVDHALRKSKERLPTVTSAEYKKNKANNCNHLELIIDRFIITANYVENLTDLPRGAIFRDDLISLNYDLFEKKEISDKVYLVLTHGGDGVSPLFASLKIPGTGSTHYSISSHQFDPINSTLIKIAKVENTDIDIDIEFNEFREGLSDESVKG